MIALIKKILLNCRKTVKVYTEFHTLAIMCKQRGAPLNEGGNPDRSNAWS